MFFNVHAFLHLFGHEETYLFSFCSIFLFSVKPGILNCNSFLKKVKSFPGPQQFKLQRLLTHPVPPLSGHPSLSRGANKLPDPVTPCILSNRFLRVQGENPSRHTHQENSENNQQ